MKYVYLRCECCNEQHIFTSKDIGKAFVALRKGVNTKEQLSIAGKLGAQKRWKNSTKTKKDK